MKKRLMKKSNECKSDLNNYSLIIVITHTTMHAINSYNSTHKKLCFTLTLVHEKYIIINQ